MKSRVLQVSILRKKSPFRLGTSYVVERADTAREARRAHGSPVSLSWGLAQAKLGVGGCYTSCSPRAPE